MAQKKIESSSCKITKSRISTWRSQILTLEGWGGIYGWGRVTPNCLSQGSLGLLLNQKKNQSIQVKSCNVLKGNMNIQIDGITMIAFHTHLNQIIVTLQHAKQNAPTIGH
jgi:hypothetical protein